MIDIRDQKIKYIVCEGDGAVCVVPETSEDNPLPLIIAEFSQGDGVTNAIRNADAVVQLWNAHVAVRAEVRKSRRRGRRGRWRGRRRMWP